MDSDSRGQIITFYSYKGGTGRTMALANVACILAGRQLRRGAKGVLIIDWDLEAPGLHRYFNSRPSENDLYHWTDPEESGPGLIDLFQSLEVLVNEVQERDGRAGELKGEALARHVMSQVALQQYTNSTPIRGLSLIKAGRFDPKQPNKYAERVTGFNWEELYRKAPHLFRVFGETLTREYSYVLIDSRTGVTDISGICTMLLPEKLVVVFTPNAQSITGCLSLIRRATDYRKQSADLRPLRVFPLASRVEANEPDLRHDWRFGDPDRDVPGYQREFEKVLAEVYGKDAGAVQLKKYFDEVQIQQIPRYAYGEAIAVLVERTEDRFSLQRSYYTFAYKLIESRVPWEDDGEGGLAKEEGRGPAAFRETLFEVLRFLMGPKVRVPLFAMGACLVAFAGLTGYLRAEREKASADEELQKIQGELAQALKQQTSLRARIETLSLPRDQRIERLETSKADLEKEARSLRADRTRLDQDLETERQAAARNAELLRQALESAERASALGNRLQIRLEECQAGINARPPA